MASETKSFAASALASVPDLDENNWVDWYRRIDDALVTKNYLYRKIMDGTLKATAKRKQRTKLVLTGGRNSKSKEEAR